MTKRLNSNFTECECVFSKKLKKLIPVFKLIPKKDDEEDELNFLNTVPGIESTYVDLFEYPETGEEFNVCDQVIKGVYDLIKKEVKPVKKIIICESWITKDLEGEKVIDQYYSKVTDDCGKMYVTPLTIKEVFLDSKSVNNNSKDNDNIVFIKKSELKNYLEKYNRKIIGGDDIDNISNDELIELSEIYVKCKLSNEKITMLKYLMFLK